jgi:protein involved in polysaccharide export with SLBB domain
MLLFSGNAMRIFLRTMLALGALGAVNSSAAQGQEQPAADARRAMATRTELDALVKQQGGALSPEETRAVQERLKNGDFAPGDRIALRVLEEPTLTDTFTVQAGRMLVLPNLPEINLSGVLRSELKPYLTKQISRYIRNPTVEAVPLLRVAVLGAVARPGFYTVPADMLTSEAIMAGGGPSPTADTRKVTVRRNGAEVRTKEQVQTAFNRGISLDQFNIQGGDEFVVPERGGGFRGGLAIAGAVSGVILAIAAATRIF